MPGSGLGATESFLCVVLLEEVSVGQTVLHVAWQVQSEWAEGLVRGRPGQGAAGLEGSGEAFSRRWCWA